MSGVDELATFFCKFRNDQLNSIESDDELLFTLINDNTLNFSWWYLYFDNMKYMADHGDTKSSKILKIFEELRNELKKLSNIDDKLLVSNIINKPLVSNITKY